MESKNKGWIHVSERNDIYENVFGNYVKYKINMSINSNLYLKLSIKK